MVPYTAIAGGGDYLVGLALLAGNQSPSELITTSITSSGIQQRGTYNYFAFLPILEDFKVDTQDIRKNFNLIID